MSQTNETTNGTTNGTTKTKQQPSAALGSYHPVFLTAKDFNRERELHGDDKWPKAKYPQYLPTWNGDEHYDDLEPFEHKDVALRADPTFPDLLGPDVKVKEISPLMGSDISGVQLSSLSDAGKDQLALLAAQRKVLVFRDQDFADQPIPKILDYGRHFGPLIIHPTSGSVEGHAELMVVHRGAGDKTMEKIFEKRTTGTTWHSDMTFERQPPAVSFMYILETPESGGDTIFANNVEAYDRLSEGFKKRLHGLEAIHESIKIVNSNLARGGIKRRDPVLNAHPIVRTHPVTKEKALFCSPHYAGSIVGYKTEESDALIKYLGEHIVYGGDFHIRVKWEPGSVVIWDNRLTNHAACFDYVNGHRRHLARLSPAGEKPYETPYEG